MLTTMTNKSERDLSDNFFSSRRHACETPSECSNDVEKFRKTTQSSTVRIDEKDLRIIGNIISTNWIANRWTVVGAMCTDRDGQKMFSWKKEIEVKAKSNKEILFYPSRWRESWTRPFWSHTPSSVCPFDIWAAVETSRLHATSSLNLAIFSPAPGSREWKVGWRNRKLCLRLFQIQGLTDKPK